MASNVTSIKRTRGKGNVPVRVTVVESDDDHTTTVFHLPSSKNHAILYKDESIVLEIKEENPNKWTYFLLDALRKYIIEEIEDGQESETPVHSEEEAEAPVPVTEQNLGG